MIKNNSYRKFLVFILSLALVVTSGVTTIAFADGEDNIPEESTKVNYILSYEGNYDEGDTVTNIPDQATSDEEGMVTLSSEIPTRQVKDLDGNIITEYEFLGWALPGSDTVITSECLNLEANTTVHAVWKEKSKTVSSYTTSKYAVTGKAPLATSTGITVQVNKEEKVIQVTIPQGYSGDADVDLTSALEEAWNKTYMPGGASTYYSIEIVNLSSHSYSYKANSLNIRSYVSDYKDGASTYDFWNEVEGYITSATGFDGNVPYYAYSIIRTGNKALQALYGVTSGSKLTVEQLADINLGSKLKEAGYSNGIEDLNNYYLDFFNKLYDTSYTKLEDFTNGEIASGIFGGTIVNKYIKETNKEVAELGYNFFYNQLIGIKGKSDEITSTADISIGAYMRGEASYEAKAVRDLTDIKSNERKTLEAIAFYIDGPYTTNPYQYLEFGFSASMSLTQTDVEPIIPVVPVDPVDPVDPVTPLPPDEYLPDTPADEVEPSEGEEALPEDEFLLDETSTEEDTNIPKTGDSESLTRWMSIIGILMIAIGATIKLKKK